MYLLIYIHADQYVCMYILYVYIFNWSIHFNFIGAMRLYAVGPQSHDLVLKVCLVFLLWSGILGEDRGESPSSCKTVR